VPHSAAAVSPHSASGESAHSFARASVSHSPAATFETIAYFCI